MKNYKKELKNHFDSNPTWGKLVDTDYLFWGIGLGVLVLCDFLAFSASVSAVATAFASLSLWVMWFGIFLAYIKDDELGMIIPTGVMSIVYLIMFIILAGKYHSVSASALINVIVYGFIAFYIWFSSDLRIKVDQRRIQQAQVAMPTIKCPNCGNSVMAGSAFCPVCGAKVPELRKCPRCGEVMAPGTQFCTKCGFKYDDQNAQPAMTCPNCHAPVTPGDDFCKVCGTKLK